MLWCFEFGYVASRLGPTVSTHVMSMTNNTEDAGPKTTIWRAQGGKKILSETISGLPFGTPIFEEITHTPQYGEVQCSCVCKSDTGKNAEIVEVKLIVESKGADLSDLK